MFLSNAATRCLWLLEASGFQAYAVGGCVRDFLLGLKASDFDLCTNASPNEMIQVFSDYQLLLHGQKHGTVAVVMDGEVVEITTFRAEGGYVDARHPEWVEFVNRVDDDLARRDFTVNAMAYNPTTGFLDLFGGQKDLENHVLRTVGDPETRFREDALRILRGARFSARFELKPEPATMAAMIQLAPLMDELARERVFEELCKLLVHAKVRDILTFAPLLTQVIPELAPSVGFLQHTPHHRYDVFTHTAYVVQNVPATPVMRWAALLHDVGKPACFTQDENGRGHFKGHAAVSREMADTILLRLKAPTALRLQVTELIGSHMTRLEPDKKLLRRRMGKLGSDLLLQLMHLQEADMISKGVADLNYLMRFQKMREMLQEVQEEDACFSVKDLAINGLDLQQIGFPAGPGMGKCLNHLLFQVQDEVLPNEKQALLSAARTFMEEML